MRKKTAKFRVLAVIVIPALVFLAACEIPQSARIKASPTFSIPVPLGEGANNSFIKSYTNVEEIRKTLKTDDDGKELAEETNKEVGIYKYDASGVRSNTTPSFMDKFLPNDKASAQTYLITYPIFDLKLNFNEYLNGTPMDTDTDKSRVPPVEISNQVANAVKWASLGQNGDLPFNQWIDPFLGKPLEVDLGDMKSLVSDITFNQGTSFSILIGDGDAEELRKAIRIRIPQLKIGGNNAQDVNSWKQGELEHGTDGKERLIFKSAGLDPNQAVLLLSNGSNTEKIDSEKISVHIRLVNTIGAENYGTELNFDWNTAKVAVHHEDRKEGKFEGFNLGSYLKNLGGNAKFERALGYLYQDDGGTGIGNDFVTIKSLTALNKGGDGFFPPNKDDIFPDEDGTLKLPSWFEKNTIPDPKQYDFTDLVNPEGAGIAYQISLTGNVEIKKDNIDEDAKITVNLAVLLPMVFTLTEDATDPEKKKITIDGDNYLPIAFQGLDDFLGGGSGGKSVMAQIEEQLGDDSTINDIHLNLSDIKNNATSLIFLAIEKESNSNTWDLVEIINESPNDPYSLRINNNSLGSLPRIKFLVKGDQPGGSGRLYIRSPEEGTETEFSVKISVEAGISLDKEIDL